MNCKIPKQSFTPSGEISLSGSKSISNRLLMIDKIGNLGLNFTNLSNSNDTIVLQRALSNNGTNTIDIENCGTAMRFLTAYFAFNKTNKIIKGDKRMQQRPIGPLVDALRQMGASISYLENEKFPPLEISSSNQFTTSVEVNTSMSSQFISAILLSLPLLKSDFTVHLKGNIISAPYISMTLNLMNEFGVSSIWKNDQIAITNAFYKFSNSDYFVEGDWSSASYWYSVVAVAENAHITIHGLKKDSFQGDSILPFLYSFLGVKTIIHEHAITLEKSHYIPEYFSFDFSTNPDLAQTVAVTCAALEIPCQLNGLETLNLKESKRIETLASELRKCGVTCITTDSTIQLTEFNFPTSEVEIDTHNDHRIAMSFLPLTFKIPLRINSIGVIDKSYPSFMDNAKTLGFDFEYFS